MHFFLGRLTVLATICNGIISLVVSRAANVLNENGRENVVSIAVACFLLLCLLYWAMVC